MYLFTSWLITCLLCPIVARFGFLKDQSMDHVVFPGPVFKQAEYIPEGHMKPLGWQRRPDSQIKQEPRMLRTREFYDKYVGANKPVVMKEAIPAAPALTTWEDDKYLTDKYGHLNVSVTLQVTRRLGRIVAEEKFVKFRKFLYDYMYDQVYMMSVLPREMMAELPLPKCVRCGTINENLVSAHLWMSSGATSSRVHSHDNHMLHCVLFGRKDFMLIEEAYKPLLPYKDNYPGSRGGNSDIDTDLINMFTYKSINRIPWVWSTILPKECVFVPAGYLAHARSYGKTVSFAIEFSSSINEFDGPRCPLEDKQFVPLSDAYFLLALEGGKLRLRDLEMTVEKVRHMLLMLVDKKNMLKVERFEHFYKQVVGEESNRPSSRAVFHLLSSGKHATELSRREILNLQKSELSKVADVINDAYSSLRKKERKMAHNGTPMTTNQTVVLKHEEF